MRAAVAFAALAALEAAFFGLVRFPRATAAGFFFDIAIGSLPHVDCD